MKILVTGGLGFVGSNLVDKLADLGHEVYVWDNLSSDSSSEDYARQDVNYVYADIRDMQVHANYHPEYEVIFHLAAHARIQPSFENPHEYLSNDIMGTAKVCELARNLGSKVVYAGSSSAYGGPMLNPYSFAKYTGEQVCEMYHKVYGLSTVTARFFNVYGPRQPKKGDWATVIGIFENLYLQSKPMTVTGTGEQRRDFTHINDIVNGLIQISEISGTGQVLNLGTGTNYSINEVAKMFSNNIEYIKQRPGEAKITQADISKTFLLTGWKPEISLPQYVEGWKNSQSA